MENWKDIKGYNGFYQVSDLGNIRSIDRISYHPRFGDMILRGRDKNQSSDKDGYKTIGLCIKGKTTTFRVHRLVALHFISNSENKPEINHKNGNKQNNAKSNLEWNTTIENIRHSIKTGLANRNGSGNGRAVLCENDVLEIRDNCKGMKVYEISKMYNVNWTTIKRILTRESWRHI